MNLLNWNLLKWPLPAMVLCGGLAFSGCDKNGNVNILSVEDDKRLGVQTDSAIKADPGQFPILPEAQHPDAYRILRAMTTSILDNSNGGVPYRTDFAWQVYIIKKDDILNAFCTPGGYIYVYTGLIKYLDKEEQLAGVMGHEIAHAALRHTSRQITQQMGYSTLISIALGNGTAGQLASVAAQLKDLSYSRSYEREADEASVKYLKGTNYACNGAAGFFEKMIADSSNGGEPPEFLSTHPNSASRVADINNKANSEGCSTKPAVNPSTYATLKGDLD